MTVQDRAQGLADGWAARLRAASADAPPLAHARPPSLAQAREHVHAVAGRYDAVPLQGARIIYGYAHLLLKFVLHAIEYCTRSPWGLVITVAAAWIVVHWI